MLNRISNLLIQLAKASFRRAGTSSINTSGSVASLEQFDLNGFKQWVLMRGQDRSKPLLLYVHGGPGSAEMALAHRSMNHLEEHFVCINWDQRGAGKSFVSGADPKTMNITQFVEDAVALIELLKLRFQQKKVFLVGHSWGTVIALKVAESRPDLVDAFISVSQVVDMKRGEDISYQYVLERARSENNTKAIRALEAIGGPPYRNAELLIQRRWLSEFHGDLFKLDMLDFFLIMLNAPEYNLSDVIRFILGSKRTNTLVWNELMTINFLRDPPSLSIPIIFFVGRQDRTTSPALILELYDVINAPSKRIVWFENSAHMPNIEEPEIFQHELIAIAAKLSKQKNDREKHQ